MPGAVRLSLFTMLSLAAACARFDPSGIPPGTCVRHAQCPEAQPMCVDDACVMCTEGPVGDAACVERGKGKLFCVTGTCAECRDDVDCQGKICDEVMGACVPCTEHEQCASGACEVTSGQCVAPEMIIYVDGQDPGADDLGECVRDAPCQTILAAIQRVMEAVDARNVIVVRGDVNVIYEGVLTMDGISATLIGQGATIRPKAAETNVPVMNIVNSGEVAIEGFKITGASSGDNADGIRCSGNTTLSLSRLLVTINDDRGMEITECSLTLLGSRISKNDKGGLLVQRSSFTLINNFIVENGDEFSGLFGGVFINNTSAKSPQIFEFNTIARNVAPSNASNVWCITTSAMAAPGNIVYEGGGAAPSTSGACNWSYSNIQGGDTNNGNIDMQPLFVDPNNGDFHLLSGSPGVDVQGLSSDTTLDFDGDSRPQGAGFDMGADEVVP